MVRFSSADNLHNILSRGNTSTLGISVADITGTTIEATTSMTTIRGIGTINGSVRAVVAGTGITSSWLRRNSLIQGSGGAVTVTATPNIAGGANGETITLIGHSDVNTVTFQDESNLANSDLHLAGGLDVTLGEFDTLTLVYSLAKAKWVEKSRSNN